MLESLDHQDSRASDIVETAGRLWGQAMSMAALGSFR